MPYGSLSKIILTVNKFLPSIIETNKNSVVTDKFAVNIRNRFNTVSKDNSDNCNSCKDYLCRFRYAGFRNFNFPAARDCDSRSKASQVRDEL